MSKKPVYPETKRKMFTVEKNGIIKSPLTWEAWTEF